MTQSSISRRSFMIAGSLMASSAALPINNSRAQDVSTLESIRKRGSLRIGWAIWYPYIFRDPHTNELSGIEPQYMKSVAKALDGIKIEWVEDSTATLIAGLQSGKFDMTCCLGITEARSRVATFLSPLLQDGTALAGLTSKIGDKSGWETYNTEDTRISVTLGSNTDLYVTDTFKNAQIVRFRSESESIAAVLAGRVDVMAIGRGSAGLVLQERPELKVVPNSLFRSYPVAQVVRKGDNEFKEWLDGVAAEQKRNGHLLEIIKQYGLDEESIPA